MAIKAVFFDVGKVLLDYEYGLAGWRLTGGNPETAAALAEFAEESEAAQAFNTGKLTGEQFYEILKEGFSLSVSYEQFQEMYCQIFEENKVGLELFHRVKEHYPIFLVSNANPLHAQYERRAFPVFQQTDGQILSCEVGFAKPDPRIFQVALEQSKVKPQEAVYLDDKPSHVEAAKSAGMKAVVFVPDLVTMLERLAAQGVTW